MRNINAEVFDKIEKWIRQSFDEIRACQTQDSSRNTLPYPKLGEASFSTAAASRQIFTALLFTSKFFDLCSLCIQLVPAVNKYIDSFKLCCNNLFDIPMLHSSGLSFFICVFAENMEFVDDILTYVDLGAHLRSGGCNVANLTSLEFTAKNGVGGCLKTLAKQFLTASVDVSM